MYICTYTDTNTYTNTRTHKHKRLAPPESTLNTEYHGTELNWTELHWTLELMRWCKGAMQYRMHFTALCTPCLHFGGVGWVGTEFHGFTSELHNFKCNTRNQRYLVKNCVQRGRECSKLEQICLGWRGKDKSNENVHFQQKHLLARVDLHDWKC